MQMPRSLLDAVIMINDAWTKLVSTLYETVLNMADSQQETLKVLRLFCRLRRGRRHITFGLGENCRPSVASN